MTTQNNYVDPLQDVDPIMEDAFSMTEESKEEFDDFEFEEVPTSPDSNQQVADVEFPNLSASAQSDKFNVDVFSNIPVKVSVELGRSKISLKEVFELTEGAIIELERLVGEPLDLVVNDQVIAQGEVVAIDNNYGLRITNIISRMQG
ncbi:MAG: flagellar motor switch protein FliN [Actinobacteria bacterium]|nr:flagellar motor switch protein FliN [Actinomycetota bacterium]